MKHTNSKTFIAALLLLILLPFSACGENIAAHEDVAKTAKKYIGTKYVPGGSSTSGFDCSGFVMFVYGKHGIKLPRTSPAQAAAGKAINLKDALPGDIVCFKINGKSISHVGIYLGENKFIHAPSSGKKVSIASINDTYWKKRFYSVVRIPAAK